MDNNSVFDFNAPQFVDFSSGFNNEEHVEAYFDVDHEIQNLVIDDDVEYHEEVVESDVIEIVDYSDTNSDKSAEIDEDIMFFSPMKTPLKRVQSPTEDIVSKGKPRRSMSTGDLLALFSQVQMEKQPAGTHQNRGTVNNNCPNKDSKTSNLNKMKSKSRDNLQFGRRKFVSEENLQKKQPCVVKYVSMAEACNLFQNRTPVRFHSKRQPMPFIQQSKKMIYTLPQSPALRTKQRLRTTKILSTDEKENLEMEEIKKHPIKAHPVNSKVLQHPYVPEIIKKIPTIMEPFKFASDPIKIKAVHPQQTEIKFHARAAPKHTNGPVKPIVHTKVYTNPISPKFSMRFQKKRALSVENLSVKSDSTTSSRVSSKPLGKTEMKPFSFEARDHMLFKKKEEKIKQFLNDEKKARQFHAKPIPKFIKAGSTTPIVRPPTPKRSNSAKIMHYPSENSEPREQFKARPATVVHKKPFVPLKPERHLVDVTEFHLNTNRRALERNEFENALKLKEEQMEIIKAAKMEEEKEKEQHIIREIRKTSVHKAQPIKKYKEIPHVSPKPFTIANSPNFLLEKREKEKKLIE